MQKYTYHDHNYLMQDCLVLQISILSIHILRVSEKYSSLGKVIEVNNEVHPVKILTCLAY